MRFEAEVDEIPPFCARISCENGVQNGVQGNAVGYGWLDYAGPICPIFGRPNRHACHIAAEGAIASSAAETVWE